ADLIPIRGPVADSQEARLRRRFAPEAELERSRRALRDTFFLPVDGDIEDVANAGDEWREEGTHGRDRVRSEVPVLERNDPTGPERLGRLPHAPDHDGNARPGLHDIDRVLSGLPLPALGPHLFSADRDAESGLRRRDAAEGRGGNVIPADRRLGCAVATDAL